MFKKLIEKLYKKYCAPKYSIVEMTRIQMLGVPQSVEVLELPPTERKQIAEEAKMLLESEVLRLAINNVKRRVMTHIQNEAQTAEIIFYDRFTINGVCLLEDELNSYSEFNPDKNDPLDEFEVI